MTQVISPDGLVRATLAPTLSGTEPRLPLDEADRDDPENLLRAMVGCRDLRIALEFRSPPQARSEPTRLDNEAGYRMVFAMETEEGLPLEHIGLPTTLDLGEQILDRAALGAFWELKWDALVRSDLPEDRPLTAKIARALEHWSNWDPCSAGLPLEDALLVPDLCRLESISAWGWLRQQDPDWATVAYHSTAEGGEADFSVQECLSLGTAGGSWGLHVVDQAFQQWYPPVGLADSIKAAVMGLGCALSPPRERDMMDVASKAGVDLNEDVALAAEGASRGTSAGGPQRAGLELGGPPLLDLCRAPVAAGANGRHRQQGGRRSSV